MPDEIHPGSLKSGTVIGTTSVIAEGVFFKGNLLGDKNLVVEGKIEGRIDLRSAEVIVAESGVVKSNIVAEHVTVAGKVCGDVIGIQQVTIAKNGEVQGNITSPRVSLEDGCSFKGSIDMDAKSVSRVIDTLKAVEKVVAKDQGDQEASQDDVVGAVSAKAVNDSF